MIKPGTLLWFALIAAAIFGVYHMKYRVQAEEEELDVGAHGGGARSRPSRRRVRPSPGPPSCCSPRE